MIALIQDEIAKFSFNTEKRKSLVSFSELLQENPVLAKNLDAVVTNAINGEWERAKIFESLSDIFEKAEFWTSERGQEVFENFDARDVSSLMIRALSNKRLDDGRVVKSRRGVKGGFYLFSEADAGVQLAPAPERPTEDEDEEDGAEELKEKGYYPFVKNWALENRWGKCEIIGGKLARRKWENPDLIHIDSDISTWSHSLIFEIVSFEVKLKVEPEAIWQASNYKSFSHYCYVAFARDKREILEHRSVFDLAKEHGLGVLAWDAESKAFHEIHPPAKHNPPVESLDEALSAFHAKGIDEIRERINESQNKLRDHFQKFLEVPMLRGR